MRKQQLHQKIWDGSPLFHVVTLNFKIFKLLPLCPCLHSIHKVMVLLFR